MKKEITNFVNSIATEESLSSLFHNGVILANRSKDLELKRWLKLELDGYFSANPVLTKADEVPKYRTVPGYHFDIYGNRLLINDPNLYFVNETRLRNGIKELEALIQSGEKNPQIDDPTRNELIKKFLGHEVRYFQFTSSSLKSVINNIRGELLERFLNLEAKYGSSSNEVNHFNELKNLVARNQLRLAIDLLDNQEDRKEELKIVLLRSRLSSFEQREIIGNTNLDDLEKMRMEISLSILRLGELMLKEKL